MEPNGDKPCEYLSRARTRDLCSIPPAPPRSALPAHGFVQQIPDTPGDKGSFRGLIRRESHLLTKNLKRDGRNIILKAKAERLGRIHALDLDLPITLHREGLGSSRGQEIGHTVFQVPEGFLRDGKPPLPGQSTKKGEALRRGGGREDRNLDVHPSRPLEINLDEVWTARSEHPEKASTVIRVRHLTGNHGIHPARDPGVAACRLPLTQRLVGFVHEYDTPPQGVQEGENLLLSHSFGGPPGLQNIAQSIVKHSTSSDPLEIL